MPDEDKDIASSPDSMEERVIHVEEVEIKGKPNGWNIITIQTRLSPKAVKWLLGSWCALYKAKDK